MTHAPRSISLTAVALAAAVFLASCGGGDAGPPAETVPPTANVASSVISGAATGPVTFTFTFSEDVGSSFAADAVSVSNGTKGAFTKVSAVQYTLVVTPAANASGSIAVNVAANTVSDLVGNKLPTAITAAQSFDTRPPVVTITSSAAGATASGDVTFTFTFSKDVGSSFTADDISVSGGTKGAFTRTSGTGATLVVSVPANNSGTIDVSVPAAAVADSGGTTNAAPATVAQAFNTVIPVVATKLVTFDEATAPKLTGFGGAEDATVVADPTNAANKVAKVVKSAGAELWAGTTVSICPSDAIVRFPFAAGSTTLSARVWSPDAGIPVRLKVEDASDGTKSVETEATTTAGGVWQTLNFNFASQVAGTPALNLATTYNKASIFFNFGKTGAQAGGAKTYYLDDLSFVGSTFSVACPGGGGGGGNFTTISMDETPAPKLTGFGGAEDATIVADPQNAANKVAKVVKSAGAELWAGTTFSTQANDALPAIAFSSTATTVTVRVLSPDANIPVRLKVENAADGSKSVETEAMVTAANTWQTLTFNFANPVAGTPALNLANTYNKASIFFNFGKTGAQAGGAKTYHFEDAKFPAAASGGGSGTTTITADETPPPALTGFGGAEDASIVADPQNAANKVAKVVKSAGAELWAGTTVSTLANNAIPAIGFSSSNTTMTVRVLSPDANIPVRLKVENAADGSKSVETEATVTAANTWQTLSFNFANPAAGTPALNLANTYNKASIFFNFGKTGAQAGGAKTYYFENLSYTTASGTGGGGGGTGSCATAGAEMGSGGAQTLVLSSGDSKGIFASGEGIFAFDYKGSRDQLGNFAAWPGAASDGTPGCGTIGYFNDTAMSGSSQKLDEGGWVVGTSLDPGGTPNFFRYFVLNKPEATFASSYIGLFANAPNNGTLNVSSFGNIKFRLWGPAEMYQMSNLNPVIEIVLSGPKVAGCTATGSGGTEIAKTFTANQKIGAGSAYRISLAGWTVKGVCGADSNATAVASVLSKLARVAFTVPASSFNFVNANPGATPSYSSGINLGPIGFTN